MTIHPEYINNVIVCSEKKEVDFNGMELLQSEVIYELCPCSYKSEKGHHHFAYNTVGLTPLSQFQNALTFENKVKILSDALSLLKSIKKYGLSVKNIKNSKEYIFRADNEFKFIYIPLKQRQQLSARDYLIKLMSILHLKNTGVFGALKETQRPADDESVISCLTDFIFRTGYSAPFDDGVLQNPERDGEFYRYGAACFDNSQPGKGKICPTSAEAETTLLGNQPAGAASAGSEETTLLGSNAADEAQTTDSVRTIACICDKFAGAETTLLTSEPEYIKPCGQSENSSCKHFLYLIRNATGRKIPVDITPFTIGKDGANMDLALSNESISRFHATIIYENSGYYIMDNGSTNGTVIEGIKLQPHERAELENGYIVTLGDESFQAFIERR